MDPSSEFFESKNQKRLHIFMRALLELLRQRPHAHIIAGGGDVIYSDLN